MSRRKSSNKTILSIVASVVLVVLAFVGYKLGIFETEKDASIVDGDFSVHFIDVGQGDCILIKTNKGNMLIDAGENGKERDVLDYLSEHEVTNLEYFIATHPHSDHIGGAAEVINNLDVKNVIVSDVVHDTVTFEKMYTAISTNECNAIIAKPGSEYTFGDVKFTVLAPFENDDNLNNMSVAIKLTYGKHSFLFTGDAEKEVEEQLLESGYDLSADVYKVAHHGSETSNTDDFIDSVNPEIAVISVGIGNSYGHPDYVVTDRLEQRNINYYMTSRKGNIVIKSDGEKLTVECEND